MIGPRLAVGQTRLPGRADNGVDWQQGELFGRRDDAVRFHDPYVCVRAPTRHRGSPEMVNRPVAIDDADNARVRFSDTSHLSAFGGNLRNIGRIAVLSAVALLLAACAPTQQATDPAPSAPSSASSPSAELARAESTVEPTAQATQADPPSTAPATQPDPPSTAPVVAGPAVGLPKSEPCAAAQEVLAKFDNVNLTVDNTANKVQADAEAGVIACGFTKADPNSIVFQVLGVDLRTPAGQSFATECNPQREFAPGFETFSDPGIKSHGWFAWTGITGTITQAFLCTDAYYLGTTAIGEANFGRGDGVDLLLSVLD